jgi:hypothetical protein
LIDIDLSIFSIGLYNSLLPRDIDFISTLSRYNSTTRNSLVPILFFKNHAIIDFDRYRLSIYSIGLYNSLLPRDIDFISTLSLYISATGISLLTILFCKKLFIIYIDYRFIVLACITEHLYMLNTSIS